VLIGAWLPAAFRQALHKAMEKSKIKQEKGKHGFRIFRHSAWALLYERSRDLKLVQGKLRHSDMSTASDIFVHLGDKILSESSEMLAEEILTNCDLFMTQKSEMVS
jgi:site-specific recombinase XerD